MKYAISRINRDLTKDNRVDKIPALILIGGRFYGMKFYGLLIKFKFITLRGCDRCI